MQVIRHILRGIVARPLCGLILILAGSAAAQVCNSTGADGALSYPTAGTYEFDPAASGLNAAGDNIFHFSSINIGPGATLRLRSSKMRSQRPVVFLVRGAVTINGGVIDLSGAAGHTATDQASLRGPSEPGPGGYPGGAGGKPGDAPQAGAGPGGAGLGVSTPSGGLAHGCPAAYAAQPYLLLSSSLYRLDPAHCPTPTTPYGNAALQPLVGGSGGSGGRVTAGSPGSGGGGGAGGGAIRICSDTSITVSSTGVLQPGAIYANGGNAGPGGETAGGPGSGGAIHLQAPTVSVSPTISGSASLSAKGGSHPSTSWDVASSGRIRIDTNSALNPETIGATPVPATGPFIAAPLPQSPTARIVSINGVSLSANPTNSAASPDVTLTSSLPVPVVVQTSNVPNGTLARFHVSSDSAVPDFVQSATINNNTATLSVPLPQGVSHLFVRVTF